MNDNEQTKMPNMTLEQFAELQQQINLKIEVDSYEEAILQPDGTIIYKTLPEGEASGYFEGDVFGVHFQTDMINHTDVMHCAAELFKENNFDVKRTGESIKREFRDYLWPY